MNIYEKLNKAKLALQAAGLKKSGKNDFAKYEYFELSDFLPTIIQLEHEIGFTCAVSFGIEQATLDIVNTEKPDESILFTSPMSSANLKGMHDVQNLGAVQTYLRRYLYVNAFEIVEHDAIDNKPSVKAESPKRDPVLTTAQRNEFGDLVKNDIDPVKAKDRLKELVTSLGYQSLSEVKQSEYDKLKNAFVEYGLPFSFGEDV